MVSTVIAGILSALFGGSNNEDDDEVIEAHEYVMDALSDADRVAIIQAVTGKDIRDQLTVQEMKEIEEEVRLRKQKNRN